MTRYGPYIGIVRDWHDGDTAHIDLDLGFGWVLLAYNPITGKPQWSCRILGINAPELSTDAGKTAHAYAEQLCPPGTAIVAVSNGWDKYGGRWDGTITLPDGTDFGQQMLNAGQAVPFMVSAKEPTQVEEQGNASATDTSEPGPA